jgi:hypothetical protein
MSGTQPFKLKKYHDSGNADRDAVRDRHGGDNAVQSPQFSEYEDTGRKP